MGLWLPSTTVRNPRGNASDASGADLHVVLEFANIGYRVRRRDRHTAKLSSCPMTALFVVAQAVELGFGSSHQFAWPGQCRQMRV